MEGQLYMGLPSSHMINDVISYVICFESRIKYSYHSKEKLVGGRVMVDFQNQNLNGPNRHLPQNFSC